MRTIAVASQKGGCGKTTTAINLAAALAYAGRRVLIVDLDPQACATQALDTGPRDTRATVYYPLMNTQVLLPEVTVGTQVERLDLVPGSVAAAGAELQLMGVPGRELRLARALSTVRDKYDLCVMDCPPSLGVLTVNALVASTDVIVPVNVDSYALQSTKRLLETVSIIRRRFHSQSAGNLRVLLTNVEDRTVLGRRVQQQMRKLFGDLIFDTVIHRTVTLAEALAAGKAAHTYAPASSGAAEYAMLAEELLAGAPGPEPEGVLAMVAAVVEEPPAMGVADAAELSDLVTSSVVDQAVTASPALERRAPSEPLVPHSGAPAVQAGGTATSHATGAAAPVARGAPSSEPADRAASPAARRRQVVLWAAFAVCWVAALIVIMLSTINHVPVAHHASVTVQEDSTVAITLTGRDPDGSYLAYTIVEGPSHGRLTGTPPNLVYIPSLNYNGPDSFTFECSDGKLVSDRATVSIAVAAVNDAPVAELQTAEGPSNRPISLTLAGSDIDGDALTFRIGDQPKHGTFALHPQFAGTGRLLYTPDPDFSGADSFTFVVNDGQTDSTPATVSLNVIRVNNPPMANVESLTTLEDTPLSITLTGTDRDGDALTYRIADSPSHGRLSGTPPEVTYTPAPDYYGPDSFTFIASDGKLDSEPAAISVLVAWANDAPVARSQSVTVEDDKPISLVLEGSDVDGDALRFSIGDLPKQGTLVYGPQFAVDGKVTYTPTPPFTGLDSFTFRVSDGTESSAFATVSLNVTHVNRPPAAVDLSVTTREDTPVSITLEASDLEGDPLTYAILTEPAHGTLEGVAPNLRYVPNTNFHGPDAFSYSVRDSHGGTGTAEVAIHVTAVNDLPVIVSEPVTGAAVGRRYTYAVKAEDVDGDVLTYSLLDSPLHMSIDPATGVIEWIPMDSQIGTFNVQVQVADHHGASSACTQAFRIAVVIPSPQKVTLTVTDGYDQRSQKRLSDTDEIPRVQAADEEACAIQAGSYIVYEFTKVPVPPGARITSFVVYIRHFEDPVFPAGALEWRIGTGWPANPTSWVAETPSIFRGPKNKGTVAWDITSYVDSGDKINSLQLLVRNNCTTPGQATFVDNLYVIVQWR